MPRLTSRNSLLLLAWLIFLSSGALLALGLRPRPPQRVISPPEGSSHGLDWLLDHRRTGCPGPPGGGGGETSPCGEGSQAKITGVQEVNDGKNCPFTAVTVCKDGVERSYGGSNVFDCLSEPGAGGGGIGLPALLPGQARGSAPVRASDAARHPGGGGAQVDSPAVSAATGELTWQETDLDLPGIGIHFLLKRTYHSGLSQYNSAYGAGWEMNIHRRVEDLTDSQGAPPAFYFNPGNGPSIGPYEPTSDPDWYALDDDDAHDRAWFKYEATTQELVRYDSAGFKEYYGKLANDSHYYYLTRVEDYCGNAITHAYEPTGYSSYGFPRHRLSQVVDTLNRSIHFTYDSSDYGRLSAVTVKDPQGASLGHIDYTYDTITAAGTDLIVLAAVTGLEIATEGASGAVQMARPTESYTYLAAAIQGTGSALLKRVHSAREIQPGVRPVIREWEYVDEASGTPTWTIFKEIDGPGSDRPAVHSYAYYPNQTQTDYVGPEGEERRFFFDAQGRITRREDKIDAATWAVTTWEYDANCTCAQVHRITYPDGRIQQYAYDSTGNVTAIWYGTAENPPKWRVEWFEWSTFDPRIGENFLRLTRQELLRDAAISEDPQQRCSDPACGGNTEVPGHITYHFDWNARGQLEHATYDAVQDRIGPDAQHLSRAQSFFYHDANRRFQLAVQEDKLGGIAVAETQFDLIVGGLYPQLLGYRTLTDVPTNESWTTSYGFDAWGRIVRETGQDGVVTKFMRDDGGRIYQVFEDWNEAQQSSARTTVRYFDEAGLLDKEVTSAQGESVVLENLRDVRGAVIGWKRTGTDGIQKQWSQTLDKNGKVLTQTDWRGFKVITSYGHGSYRLPIRIQREYGGTTSDVWLAGETSAASGYDLMGRLLAWRNAAGWKGYQTYDTHGRPYERFEEVFETSGTTYYGASRTLYGARGYPKEIESGRVSGNPLDAGRVDHWQLHTVVKTNTAGDPLSVAIYPSGSSQPARIIDYVVDGLGRQVRATALHGDRALGLANAKKVVTRIVYDALGRPTNVKTYLGEPNVLTEASIDYQDALRRVELLLFEGGRSWRVVTEADRLGRVQSRTQYDEAQAGARTSTFEYDGFDHLTAQVDALGLRREMDYDGLGRVVEERLVPMGGGTPQVTVYAWDSTTGVLDSVTDAEGSMTTFEYYPARFLLPKKTIHPDGRWSEVVAYDVLDRPTSIRNSRNIGHNYTYNRSYLVEDGSFVIDPAPPLPANALRANEA